jgi:hypothetical protein
VKHRWEPYKEARMDRFIDLTVPFGGMGYRCAKCGTVIINRRHELLFVSARRAVRQEGISSDCKVMLVRNVMTA